MGTLTESQRVAYEFIKRFIEQFGYPPSYEEIRIGLGYTAKSAVAYQVARLERAGYITHSPRKSRTIRITGITEALRE